LHRHSSNHILLLKLMANQDSSEFRLVLIMFLFGLSGWTYFVNIPPMPYKIAFAISGFICLAVAFTVYLVGTFPEARFLEGFRSRIAEFTVDRASPAVWLVFGYVLNIGAGWLAIKETKLHRRVLGIIIFVLLLLPILYFLCAVHVIYSELLIIYAN
jgi:hypothetical protein